jgi:hypothetical protein
MTSDRPDAQIPGTAVKVLVTLAASTTAPLEEVMT